MSADPAIRLIVPAPSAGTRLDRFCAGAIDDLSRNQIQNLNRLGGIRVDGMPRPDSYAVSPGDTIELDRALLVPEALRGGAPVAEHVEFPIVFRDDHVVVVNKPPGLVVHPAHGNWRGTLVNGLLGRGVTLAGLGLPDRPGVVHRLDRDTSGLMVLARTDMAYRSLVAQIKDATVKKSYHAIVWGHVPSRQLDVDAPIGRHPRHRQQMAVVDSGKPARSTVFVVDAYGHFDYIRVTICTGRTHQIRVHMMHVGNPVLGDPVYGGRKLRGPSSQARFKSTCDKLLRILTRHALHASTLAFIHPATGKRLTFSSALPADMRTALETLQCEERIREVSG